MATWRVDKVDIAFGWVAMYEAAVEAWKVGVEVEVEINGAVKAVEGVDYDCECDDFPF